MKNKSSRRQSSAINAGSMADIAFLLLIFFLVTTTITSDQGVLVKLPPWYDEVYPASNVLTRNILKVSLNANDQLLVMGEEITTNLLKEKVKTFILNPEKDLHLAIKPQAAVVSLIHDRGTSYEAYLSTYNELKAAYNELWEAAANENYGKSYAALDKTAQKKIRSQIPLIISEAEPLDYDKKG